MRFLAWLLGSSLIAGCALDANGRSAFDEDSAPGADSELSADSTIDGFTDDTTMTDTATTDTVVVDTAAPPDTAMDDSFKPDTFMPDTFMPDTFMPDTFVPDTFVPDTFMPDTFMPDTFVPDTFVRDTFVADTFVPDTFVADTFVPDTFVADTAKPDTAMPPPCTEANSGMYNGHCYFLVASGTDWAGARDACVAASTTGHPAHLAVITTVGEWSFVNGLPGGGSFGRWIGLSSTVLSNKKSDFTWITGEAFAYDAWLTGHPNRSGMCVVMHSAGYTPPGSWEDVSCTASYEYICERE